MGDRGLARSVLWIIMVTSEERAVVSFGIVWCTTGEGEGDGLGTRTLMEIAGQSSNMPAGRIKL